MNAWAERDRTKEQNPTIIAMTAIGADGACGTPLHVVLLLEHLLRVVVGVHDLHAAWTCVEPGQGNIVLTTGIPLQI